MSKCFRCGESYPSAKVLEIHKNHCDGKTATPVVRTNPTPKSFPVRTNPTPKPFANPGQRSQASRKTPSRATPALVPIQPIAVSINEGVYVGSFVTLFMGAVLWACVMALTSFVDPRFSPMFLFAAASMAMGILSLTSQRSPNELAAAMIQGGREVRSGQFLMGGLSVALGAGMFFTNSWLVGQLV